MATYKKWTSTVLVNGQPEPNVKVYVYEPGTTNEIPIYEDEGATPITQPILTDSQGRYAFFVDVDTYPEIRLYLEKDGVDFSEVNEDLDGVPVPGAGGGAGTFTELTDTPSSYVGRGGDVVVVKTTEDGIETQPWPVTGTVLNVFLSSDAADIGDYYYMYHTETGDTHSEFTSPSLSTGNDQLLWSFVTEAGQPGLNQLALGAYTATLFLKKSGNKDVRVYWKLFKRDTGGTETEILQSAVSDYLTADNSQYLISGYLNEDQALDPTDRLVLKLFANVSGTGTDVTVTLTMEGDYDSRLAIHVLSSAFSLDRLSDVTLSSPSDKQMLAYDAASEKWINQTPEEAGVLASDGSVPLTGDWDTGGFRISNLKSLNFKDATTLTIFSGAITVSQSYHYVDTEGGASSDDLETINGGAAGDILYLRSADSSRTVVIKHGTGNIVTPDGTDYSLDSTDKVVALLYDGTNWHLVGAAGGGGGGATQLNDLSDVTIASPVDNDLLVYSASSGTWTNLAPAMAGVLALDSGIHNVKTYGAVGDGSTDDTAAIQSAMDAAGTDGGVVFFPPGTYKITSTLDGTVMGNGATLLGAGIQDSIIYNANTAGQDALKFDGQFGICIMNLGIKGNSSSGHGVAFYATSFPCWNVLVQHCWLHSHGGSGLYADSLFSSAIRDCYFGGSSGFENAEYGIKWINGGNSNIIEGCWFRRIQDGQWGIVKEDGSRLSIRACNFSADEDSITWYGILLKNVKQWEISFCNFECDGENTLGAGIQLGDGTPTYWGDGRIAHCNFVANTGTISKEIYIAKNAFASKFCVYVEGDMSIDASGLGGQGWVYVSPFNPDKISNDVKHHVIGYAPDAVASSPTSASGGPVVYWYDGSTRRTYQIGVDNTGSVVADQVS